MASLILDNGEPLLGLAAATKAYGVHPATAQRWCSRGCNAKSGRRVKLEHVRAGGKLKTSAAAVKRFFAALGDDQEQAEQQPAGRTPTPAERRKAAEAAAKELERMGA